MGGGGVIGGSAKSQNFTFFFEAFPKNKFGFEKKIWGSKINSGPKKFWVQKNFGSKKCCVQKNVKS